MFSELVKNNRTKRIYTGEKVPMLLLRELIEDCRYSSAAINKQVIRYYLVNDEETCLKIFRITNLPTTHKVPEENRPGAFVVMTVERDLNLPESFLYYNLGIATANLSLSASTKGYNCVTLLSTNMEKLAGILELEENRKAVSVIAVGKSEQQVITVDIDRGETSYYKEGPVHVVPKLTANALILREI